MDKSAGEAAEPGIKPTDGGYGARSAGDGAIGKGSSSKKSKVPSISSMVKEPRLLADGTAGANVDAAAVANAGVAIDATAVAVDATPMVGSDDGLREREKEREREN